MAQEGDLEPQSDDSARDDEEQPVEIMGPIRHHFRGWAAPSAVLTIENDAVRRMRVTIEGAPSYRGDWVDGWRIDFGSLNVQMNDLGRFLAAYQAQGDEAGREAWQRAAAEIGAYLYRGLINTDADLARQWLFARRRIFPPENLALVFAGPRAYLSVPYELLRDGRAPLAIQHPICRRIADAAPLPSVRLRALSAYDTPVRALLISSGAWEVDADEEIAALRDTLQARALKIGVQMEIDTLWAGNTRLDEVKRRLARCAYPIVHYAGQVYHDRLRPEDSGLLFATERGGAVGQALLPMRELADLLRGGQTQLFYLSACVGPQTWGDALLRDVDYLDAFDLLVRAGIPYVLGFRWPVTEAGRRLFARHFYESLFVVPPERAALSARQTLYRYDETWASPILIAQLPGSDSP